MNAVDQSHRMFYSRCATRPGMVSGSHREQKFMYLRETYVIQAREVGEALATVLATVFEARRRIWGPVTDLVLCVVIVRRRCWKATVAKVAM